VRFTPVADLDADRGRLVRLDRHTAARLGIGTGAIVELVNPRGAPLRAWVDSLMPGDGPRGEIAPGALAMLGLDGGGLVELRALHSGTLG
jgi:anaerobic selenocysteine-containing dehydrogenase